MRNVSEEQSHESNVRILYFYALIQLIFITWQRRLIFLETGKCSCTRIVYIFQSTWWLQDKTNGTIDGNVFKYLIVFALMQCEHFFLFLNSIYVFTHASVQEFGTMLYINDAKFYFITANTAHPTYTFISSDWNGRLLKVVNAFQLQATYRSIYAFIKNDRSVDRSIDQTIDRFGLCGADDCLWMNRMESVPNGSFICHLIQTFEYTLSFPLKFSIRSVFC